MDAEKNPDAVGPAPGHNDCPTKPFLISRYRALDSRFFPRAVRGKRGALQVLVALCLVNAQVGGLGPITDTSTVAGSVKRSSRETRHKLNAT
jgi:hypothetical protein